jgi:hypothetical protein
MKMCSPGRSTQGTRTWVAARHMAVVAQVGLDTLDCQSAAGERGAGTAWSFPVPTSFWFTMRDSWMSRLLLPQQP